MQIFWGQSNKSRAQSVCKFIRSAHSYQSESDLKHKLGKPIIYPFSEGDLRKDEYEPMDTPGNMTTAQMPLGYYGFFAYFVAQFKAAAWMEDPWTKPVVTQSMMLFFMGDFIVLLQL